MRIRITKPSAIGLALLLFGLSAALSASAASTEAPLDASAALHSASFYSVHAWTTMLPGGSLSVGEGVVATFGDNPTQYLFSGTGSLDLSQLPSAGSLNLLGRVASAAGQTGLDLPCSAFLLQKADVKLPAGTTQTWDQLSADKQEAFTRAWLQSYSDGLADEQSMAPRAPDGKELFLAAWCQPSWEDSPVRYDLRVSADASEISIEDYYRGSLMYQSPWSPEKDEADPALQFNSIDYSYSFTPAPPAADGEEPLSAGSLDYEIKASFTLSQDRSELLLLSQPWLGLPLVTGDTRTALSCSRGGGGRSAWTLRVPGNWKAGQNYRLQLSGSADVPPIFSAIGYAGVYRFETSALWPGEDSAHDVSIALRLPAGNWSYSASNGAAPLPDPDYGNRWHFSAATRNCMIVATQFPSKDIATSWGRLTVFAPPDLIDRVPEMGSVKAIGPVLSYYQSLWGPRSMNNGIVDDGMPITEQNIYLIPGESGVQAFEDAGLVFILGGEESYGGSGQSLPVMAHELAHLWWGHGFSGPRWFVEGMANYASCKFLEHYYGPGGEAEGAGEPVSYRRYIINFALSHALPLSIEQRDELDDSGAIYHNSAGFLLTADQRLSGGFDPVLSSLYRGHEYQPALNHAALEAELTRIAPALAPLWTSYVEDGKVDRADVEDDSYRECVLTPGREKYTLLLRWLVPMRRKASVGDYAGAIFCGEQALAYRSEPKDYLYLADLHFRSGDVAGARAIVESGKAGDSLDNVDGLKATWLLARIYGALGETAAEREMLGHVVQLGPQFGMLSEAEAAGKRLAELDATAGAAAPAAPGGN